MQLLFATIKAGPTELVTKKGLAPCELVIGTIIQATHFVNVALWVCLARTPVAVIVIALLVRCEVMLATVRAEQARVWLALLASNAFLAFAAVFACVFGAGFVSTTVAGSQKPSIGTQESTHNSVIVTWHPTNASIISYNHNGTIRHCYKSSGGPMTALTGIRAGHPQPFYLDDSARKVYCVLSLR